MIGQMPRHMKKVAVGRKITAVIRIAFHTWFSSTTMYVLTQPITKLPMAPKKVNMNRYSALTWPALLVGHDALDRGVLRRRAGEAEEHPERHRRQREIAVGH